MVLLKCNGSENKIDAVFIEGHADARPYSPTIKDNQELSTRALSAFNAIVVMKI